MVDIAASVPVLRLKIGILGEMNSERIEIAICVLPDDIGPIKKGAVKSLSMQWMLLLKAHIMAKTKAHLPLSLILYTWSISDAHFSKLTFFSAGTSLYTS